MKFLVWKNLTRIPKKTLGYTKEHKMGVLLQQEYFHQKMCNYKKNNQLQSKFNSLGGNEKQNLTHMASFWKKGDQKEKVISKKQ